MSERAVFAETVRGQFWFYGDGEGMQMLNSWLSYADLLLLIPASLLWGRAVRNLLAAVVEKSRDPTLHTAKTNLKMILVLTIMTTLGFFFAAHHFLSESTAATGQAGLGTIHGWVIAVLCIYGGVLCLIFAAVPMGKLWLNRAS